MKCKIKIQSELESKSINDINDMKHCIFQHRVLFNLCAAHPTGFPLGQQNGWISKLYASRKSRRKSEVLKNASVLDDNCKQCAVLQDPSLMFDVDF